MDHAAAGYVSCVRESHCSYCRAQCSLYTLQGSFQDIPLQLGQHVSQQRRPPLVRLSQQVVVAEHATTVAHRLCGGSVATRMEPARVWMAGFYPRPWHWDIYSRSKARMLQRAYKQRPRDRHTGLCGVLRCKQVARDAVLAAGRSLHVCIINGISGLLVQVLAFAEGLGRVADLRTSREPSDTHTHTLNSRKATRPAMGPGGVSTDLGDEDDDADEEPTTSATWPAEMQSKQGLSSTDICAP